MVLEWIPKPRVVGSTPAERTTFIPKVILALGQTISGSILLLYPRLHKY